MGFLFRTKLGCALVVLVVLIAVVLMLPSFLGGFAKNTAQQAFANRFHGSLSVESVSLAWFGEQHVDGAVVRDPEGHDIARASLTLPSLVSLLGAKGGKIGRVVVAVDADLVQDDAGVTNLQRALAPRETEAPKSDSRTEPSSFDPMEFLARLDLDLVVEAKKLSWSDAETRRLRIPFEVRDLTARVTAMPGAPIDVKADGRLVSEQPGALHATARLNGPITNKGAWPFGKVDAQVKVEGFSTAMIDGIADLKGNLKEVLGNRFTLEASAKGATLDSGDVSVTLNGERASIAMSGRFEDGAFRSTSEPGLVATFPAPRGFLKTYLDPQLPPGTVLAIDTGASKGDKPDTSEPWVVRATRFVLPLPPPEARTLAALRPTLEKAQLDAVVHVPASFAIENDTTRAAHVALAVRGLHLEAHTAPNAPLTAHVDATLESGTSGNLSVDVSARDAWAKLAAGALPIVDVQATVQGLSSKALGALANQAERLPAAIGALVDVQLDARDVSLDAGSVKLDVVGHDVAVAGANADAGSKSATERLVVAVQARVENGLVHVRGDDRIALRWNADAEWRAREIAAVAPAGTTLTFAGAGAAEPLTVDVRDAVMPMPGKAGVDFLAALKAQSGASVKVHVPGATYADPTLRAAGTNVVVRGLDVAATLTPGGAVTSTIAGDLSQGASQGRLAVNASVANAWRFADGVPPAQWPPVDAHVELVGIPTALLDAFVNQGGLVRRVLGDDVGISIDARGASVNGGAVQVEARATRASVSFAGRVEGGVLRSSGDDHLGMSLTVPADVARETLAPYLPADTTLTWPGAGVEVAVTARELSVALPTEAFDLNKTLDALAVQLQVRLAGVGVQNATTRAAKLDVGMRDVVVDAVLTPKAPAKVKLSAGMTPGTTARLAVDATMADPFAVVKGTPLQPIEARVDVTDLDTSSIDALVGPGGTGGRAGWLADLLGPKLTVAITAHDAAAAGDDLRGTFGVDARSEHMTARVAAKLAGGRLTCTGDDGVDVSIALAPKFVELQAVAYMPAGSRVQLASDAGPLRMTLRDVAVTLPKSAPASAPSSTTSPAAGTTPNLAGPGVASKGAAPAASTVDMKSVLDMVSQLALKLDVQLPAIVYSDASTDAAQRPIQLRDLRVTSTLSPTALPFANVSATIVDEPAGQLTADVRALDALSKLSEANGLDTWRAKVDVHASAVPTAILDALAGQGGLLVESLGPRVEITVQAPEVSITKGDVSAEMVSAMHSVKAQGHLANRTFVVDHVDGIVASLGLGPVMSQRVVGKLVPTLVNVRKAEGSTPAKFSVDALSFPLDGDLRKLDGSVRIDLGEVSYSLFPKLEAYLGDGPGGMQSLKVPVLTVPIQKGVAGYQRLPVKIGSREFLFSGTYDIVTDVAQLTANVPVKYLGKKISSELEDVREYVDPELTLPLTIRGSLLNPSIGLDEGAFKKVLEDAGKRALEKAGGNLLDDLLKKKKKKKD